MEALAHLRVIELSSDIAAAYGGRMYASWGADVTVLEPETGSPIRQREPLVAAPDGSRHSMLWQNVAASKSSVTYGAAGPAAHVAALTADADLFLTDWRRRDLAAAGIDLDALRAANPRLVVVAYTPFGEDGPYADFEATELVLEAIGGSVYLNGDWDKYPLKGPGNLAMFAAGVHGFIGGIGALQERKRSGSGQVVEISCLEAWLSTVPLMRTEFSGVNGNRRPEGPLTGAFQFKCADGNYITLSAMARSLGDMAIALGKDPEEVIPAEMRDPRAPRNQKATLALLADLVKDHAAQEIYDLFGEMQITLGIALKPTQVLESEQLKAREYFHEIQHPKLGTLKLPGGQAKFSLTPQGATEPAPELAPPSPAPAAKAPSAPVSTNGHSADLPTRPPLAGMRIVDLTHVWNGPYGAMLLADLGADVIKIETYRHADIWRHHGGPWPLIAANPKAHPWNINGSFGSVNRNKRSVWLDLATPDGKEAFLDLVKDADLVINNFTPRVMDNLGLGHDVLKAINPRVSLISFSGYGNNGPHRNFRASAPMIESTAGWSSLIGYPGGPPGVLSVGAGDPLAGLHLCAMSMVALESLHQTGGAGQFVEGSMIEADASYIGEEFLAASATHTDPERNGNRDRAMVPHGVFPCSGEDNWVAISVRNDADWQKLLQVPGVAETGLNDARFATTQGRRAAEDEVEEKLGRWTAQRTNMDAMKTLQAAGIPAGIVARYTDIMDSEHHAARQWFQRLSHPDLGTHRYPGFAWRFTRTPCLALRPPPRIGEHSVEILSGMLNRTPQKIHEMMLAEVTGTVLYADGETRSNV